MKIGLLGGTFNPIHMGHLILAQECWDQLTLDKVIFVPSFIPPHKHMETEVSAHDRLNMVRLALEGDDRFEISTYEIDRKDVSYTIDTIRHFRSEDGNDVEIFFLTGADSAETLSMWKNADDILKECTFVAASRPGWGEDSAYEDRIKRLIMPNIEISSTAVRQRIRDRRPIDHMVPQKVVQYIRKKGLYR